MPDNHISVDIGSKSHLGTEEKGKLKRELLSWWDYIGWAEFITKF